MQRQKTKFTLLIAGASGLIGRAAIEYFSSLPEWKVLTLSRRALDVPKNVTHIPVDLTDAKSCEAASQAFTEVTHVLYTALFELPDLISGWRDARQMQTNELMLRNLVDSMEKSAKRFRHITIMQGTKAYGGHVEPARLPSKERFPRHNHENFYWLQEDLLRTRQRSVAWTFSILRPQYVFGYAVGSPMNIIAAIGTYAAIQRELDQPLSFPGGQRYICAATDANLIAKAAHFCFTHEIACNETYNVANGDILVWQDIWGSIASRFSLDCGQSSPVQLEVEMPKHESTWSHIVDKYNLQRLSLEQIVGSSWQFTDRAFGLGTERTADASLSTIKLRQHGFHDCIDTEDSLHEWLDRMQDQRLLPPQS